MALAADEFLHERSASDRQVWVRHRASGHLFKFTMSADFTVFEGEPIIEPNPDSKVDPKTLLTAGRDAARFYRPSPTFGMWGGAATTAPSPPAQNSPHVLPNKLEIAGEPPKGIVQLHARGEARASGGGRLRVDGIVLPPIQAIPPQASGGSQFTMNDAGQIDLIPDPADVAQRELYEELRRTARELVNAGHNQLGDLNGTASDFLEALPEFVGAASIVRVWSRGNSFRLRLAAHETVAASEEPDPARLTPSVAAKLRDVVENFNAFISRDSRGRELDEVRLGPQEHDEALAAVEAASPLVEAIRSSAIATSAAVEALTEQLASAHASSSSQVDGGRALALANNTTRNFVGTWLRRAYMPILALTGVTFAEMRAGLVSNAAWDLIKAVAQNADRLMSFVTQVFHSQAMVNILNAIIEVGKYVPM